MAEDPLTDESLAWKTRDKALKERVVRDKVSQLPLYWETGRTRLQKLRLKAINRGEDPDKIVIKSTARQEPNESRGNNRNRVSKSRGRKNNTIPRHARTGNQKLRTQGTRAKKTMVKSRRSSNGGRIMHSDKEGNKDGNKDGDEKNQSHGYIGSRAYRDMDARLHQRNYARDNKLPYDNNCHAGLYVRKSAPERVPEEPPISEVANPEPAPAFSKMIAPLKEYIITETLPVPRMKTPCKVRQTYCSSPDETEKEELGGNAQHTSKNTSLKKGGILSVEEDQSSQQAPSIGDPSTNYDYRFPLSNERNDKTQVKASVERGNQIHNSTISRTNTSIKTRGSNQKTSGQDDTHNHSNVFQQTGKGAKILPSGSKHIYHTSSPEKRNPVEAQDIPFREIQKIQQDADKRKLPMDKSSGSHDDHGISLHGKRHHSPSNRSPDAFLIVSPERKKIMRAQKMAQKEIKVVDKTQDQSISTIPAADDIIDKKQTSAGLGASGVIIDTASAVMLARKEQYAGKGRETERRYDEKVLKTGGKSVASEKVVYNHEVSVGALAKANGCKNQVNPVNN